MSRSTRRWKKLCGKNTWFKQKNKNTSQEGDARSNKKKLKKPPEIEGVMYVPFTENSSLKKQMQSAEDQFNGNSKTGKVRILERLGPTVMESVANPYPWKGKHCGRPNCHSCKSKEGECKSRGVVYSITCLECKSVGTTSQYLGETHRTQFDRIQEHFKLLENRSKESALLKHWEAFHEGKNNPKFSVRRVGSYLTTTERQIREALKIEAKEYDHIINSKAEWGMNSIPRQKSVYKDEITAGNQAPVRPPEELSSTEEVGEISQNKRLPDTDTLFSSQYSQRRKRQRIEKQQDRSDIVLRNDRDNQKDATIPDSSRNPNSSKGKGVGTKTSTSFASKKRARRTDWSEHQTLSLKATQRADPEEQN